VSTVGSVEANGSLVTRIVSQTYDKVSENDLISVDIPAEIGIKATDGNWWTGALHLGLNYRIPLQISPNNGWHQNFIYVYYRKEGSVPPPNYLPIHILNNISSNQSNTSSEDSVKTGQSIYSVFEVRDVLTSQKTELLNKGNDPQVYSVNRVMLKKFEQTGFNPQPIDAFLLPSQGQAITGVILKVTGKAYGDGYSRYLRIYINGQFVDQKTVRDSGQGISYSFDITNYIYWWNENPVKFNNGEIVLTTFVGYWTVRAEVYVVYNAEGNFRLAHSQYEEWYKFEGTGFNIIQFPAQLPESVVNVQNGAKITIHAKSYGDSWSRFLDLYIDGQMVHEWTIYNEVTVTYDITNQVLGKSGITVGIVLTTFTGYWIVDGNIEITYRPGVAPENSIYWSWQEHSLTYHAGNIFGNCYPYHNEWAALYSSSTTTKEYSTKPTLRTAVTITVPDSATKYYFVAVVRMNIKAKHETGVYISGDRYENLEAFKNSPSGSDIEEIGSDLLQLLAAGLSISRPELAAIASAASVLINYIPTGEPSIGHETNGIFFNWMFTLLWMPQDTSFIFKYDVNFPWLGWYTFEVGITVDMYCLEWEYYGVVANHHFTDTFTYYNGPQ